MGIGQTNLSFKRQTRTFRVWANDSNDAVGRRRISEAASERARAREEIPEPRNDRDVEERGLDVETRVASRDQDPWSCDCLALRRTFHYHSGINLCTNPSDNPYGGVVK